jgi:hypothetical protein
MTTTDRARAARPVARITLSALEWRLYLVTALAVVYTAAWIALAAAIDPTLASAPAAVADGPAAAIWIDQLPIATQPQVIIPAGWMRAPAAPAAPAAASAIRAPMPPGARVNRPVRIRTRSS